MKKVLSMIVVAAFATAIVACGPSKEEMERRNKEKEDSIANVERERQESIAAAAMEQERLAEEANQKRMADSTRTADSTAAAGKKGKKK